MRHFQPHFYLFLFVLCSCSLLLAQQTKLKVGNDAYKSTTPEAVLEIESATKGVLLPRVALTSTLAPAPLASFVKGMLVYNTATAGIAPDNVVPGLYTCDGTAWIKTGPSGNQNSTNGIYNGSGDLQTGTTTVTQAQNKLAFVTDNTATDAFNVDANTLSVDALNNRVGVGNAAPASTLDIVGAPADITKIDGVQLPRLTLTELTAKGDGLYTAAQHGAIINITDATGTPSGQRLGITTVGHYFFNWNTLANSGAWISIAPTEPWYKVGTTEGATQNTDDVFLMGRVGINASTLNGGNVRLEVKDGDAIIDGLTVGLGGGYVATNTALGKTALAANTTGANNTVVGNTALAVNTTGANNTAVGSNALAANTTGENNTAVGVQALRNFNGYNNTALGSRALQENLAGISNTAVGSVALNKNTGDTNTAIGDNALTLNTAGNQNTAVGAFALRSNTVASSNTAIGSYALAANIATGGTAIGAYALEANTLGSSNTAVGSTALQSNTTGVSNTALGNAALRYNLSGGSNTALGASALINNTTGSSNTAVGMGALSSTTVSGGTALGSEALVANTTGVNNTALGFGAGKNITTGGNNTLVGYGNATTALTTGSNNTLIGANITLLDPTTSNAIVLADGAGNKRLLIDSNGRVGIKQGATAIADPRAAGDASITLTNPVVPNVSAALDINSTTGGLLVPRMTSSEISQIPSPANGLIVFDTDQSCIRLYQNDEWTECLTPGGIKATSNASSFTGIYMATVAATGNTFTTTITNNGLSQVGPLAMTTSDLVLSGVSGITVSSVSPTSVTVAPGAAQVVTYTLGGTPPTTGTLTAKWKKYTLSSSASTTVEPYEMLLTTLTGASATFSTAATDNTSSYWTSMTVPYTGSTGGTFAGQTIASTGATGLTATLVAGSIGTGAGSFTLTVAGTPNTTVSTNASFTFTLGKKTTTVTMPVMNYMISNLGVTNTTAARSCNTIKLANNAATDGLYWIDMDGVDTSGDSAAQRYCDMTYDGGGWTLVGAWGSAVPPSQDTTPANLNASATVSAAKFRMLAKFATKIDLVACLTVQSATVAGADNIVRLQQGAIDLVSGATLRNAFNGDAGEFYTTLHPRDNVLLTTIKGTLPLHTDANSLLPAGPNFENWPVVYITPGLVGSFIWNGLTGHSNTLSPTTAVKAWTLVK